MYAGQASKNIWHISISIGKAAYRCSDKEPVFQLRADCTALPVISGGGSIAGIIH